MNRAWSRTAKIMVVVFVLVICAPSTAYAYRMNNQGYYSKSIGVDATSLVNSVYTTAVANGISAWNSAGVPSKIYKSTGYLNKIYTERFPDAWYGYYGPIYQDSQYYPHPTTRFWIYINRTYLDPLAYGARKQVVLHEFGHAMGLADLGLYDISVMNIRKAPGTYQWPQTDDISGVKASWP